MEIIIETNQLLKKRLLYIADHVLHGGHWGKSDLLIPEQQILLNLLKESDYYLCLSLFNCQMLVDWFKEATGQGSFMLAEDIFFVKSLSASIADYYAALAANDLYEQRVTENLIVSLDRLLFKHNKKKEHSHMIAEHVDPADRQNLNQGSSVSALNENNNSQFRKIVTKLNSFLGKHAKHNRILQKKELENQLKKSEAVTRAHKKGHKKIH